MSVVRRSETRYPSPFQRERDPEDNDSRMLHPFNPRGILIFQVQQHSADIEVNGQEKPARGFGYRLIVRRVSQSRRPVSTQERGNPLGQMLAGFMALSMAEVAEKAMPAAY